MQLSLSNIFVLFFILFSILETSAHPIVKLHKRAVIQKRDGKCVPRKSGSEETTAPPTPASTAEPKPTDNRNIASTSSHHSSSSSSSSDPISTQSPSAPQSKLNLIFPLAGSILSPNAIGADTHSTWSVSNIISNALPLNDDTLNPTRVEKSLAYSYGTAPDGKKSLEITYPAGTSALSGSATRPGGVSFYAPGPSNVDLLNAKEITFAYSVLFQEGFEFNMGGKLPGVYGGDDPEGSITCSGGAHRDNCFSSRLMWRTKGAGESYLYLPSSERFPANKKQCTEIPGSSCNDAYGNSIGRGSFKFTPGVRTFIAQRVRLNDAGKSNGELELFQDGKSIFTLSGIVFRQSGAGRIRGIQMQSFFGGHGSQWASPKTQHSYLGDFSLAITETL